MLKVSPHSIARSSLEEMLDSLRRRDEGENQKDLPPALPSRPTSKARLPKRLIQGRLNMENVVSKVISNNNNMKKQDGNVGVRGRGGGGGGCSFGRRKVARVCNEAEWDDSIGYFVNKQLRVWCRPRNDQWELAKIKSAVGEEASVTLLNGNVVTVSTRDLLPANTEILDGVDDLVELSYLNEPSVLHNLQHRYDRDVIYSKAGPVLLAMNPFKDVPIYGNDFVTAYREKILDNPHVYATADAAYDEMMRDGGNQSIIISGESGSGKTETAKFAMQYLASVRDGNSGITTKITQSSCILEAFGNAKTSTNCNSSRFGKIIDMHYSLDGKISGACIQTLPLEKSRVSQLCRGERSYHIFYQICAGAPSSLKDILNLKMASEYKFLNQSGCLKINGVDDAHNFIMLTEALDALGFSYQNQEDIFELLAAILWLGNISFEVIEEEHVKVKVDEASRSAARLMGCEMDDLISVLSTNRANEMTEPLTLQQATNKRDAMANYVYKSMFNWIVGEINRSLEGDKQHAQERTISLVDTYGFESFQKNSFQQLLINYADERLLQHFIRHLCKLEQEMEYSSGEESKLSESEIFEYKDKPYEQLRNGTYKVKYPNGILRRPFCASKKKQNFKHKDLHQHASRVSKGSSNRSAKQKANHLALALYLENDLANEVDQPLNVASLIPEVPRPKETELFCWPWTGFVVNIVKEVDTEKDAEDAEYWMERFIKYKPESVEIVTDEQRQSALALVRFNSDWIGFNDACAFEKAFAAAHHSKTEWSASENSSGSSVYAWLARATDFESPGPIGDYLRAKTELKTVSDLEKEIVKTRNKQVVELASELDLANENIDNWQIKCNQNQIFMSRILKEIERGHQAYTEARKKIQDDARVHVERVLDDQDKRKADLEKLSKELDARSKELNKKEAVTEHEKQKLEEEKRKNHAQKTSLNMASIEQKISDESVYQLLERQKVNLMNLTSVVSL